MTQVNSYKATDVEIALQADFNNTYIATKRELGGYNRVQGSQFNSEAIVGEDYPLITITSKSHSLGIIGLIYNDGTAADKLRILRRQRNTFANFVKIQRDSSNRLLFGRAVLAIPNVAGEGGIFKLTPGAQGEGALRFCKLHNFKALPAEATEISKPPETYIAHLGTKGNLTKLTLRITVGSDNYDIVIPVTKESLAEVTPLKETAKIPANTATASMTLLVEPAAAKFSLDIGV